MQEFKIKIELGRAQKTKDQQILAWQKKSRSNQVSYTYQIHWAWNSKQYIVTCLTICWIVPDAHIKIVLVWV